MSFLDGCDRTHLEGAVVMVRVIVGFELVCNVAKLHNSTIVNTQTPRVIIRVR